MKKILLLFILILNTLSFSNKLKIGVSMVPYYSFVKNIVKEKADVIQILPTNVDVHSYKPSHNEVKIISNLDALVINGTGIDNYMYELVKGSNNNKIKIIDSSKNVSLLPNSGQRSNIKSINTHTFIAIGAAISQINTIADEIAKLDPNNAIYYKKNAREYNRKLSRIKSNALSIISKLLKENNIEVATTHAGYDYLLTELGLSVAVVVEPSNNSKPTATDLKESIKLIKDKKINILFESDGSSSPYTKQIANETNIVIKKLLHMTNGKYTEDAFEKDTKNNINTIIDALKRAK